MKDWFVGQKIVCVDNDWLHQIPKDGPQIGHIYTIDGIEFWDKGGLATFSLSELDQTWG